MGWIYAHLLLQVGMLILDNSFHISYLFKHHFWFSANLSISLIFFSLLLSLTETMQKPLYIYIQCIYDNIFSLYFPWAVHFNMYPFIYRKTIDISRNVVYKDRKCGMNCLRHTFQLSRIKNHFQKIFPLLPLPDFLISIKPKDHEIFDCNF